MSAVPAAARQSGGAPDVLGHQQVVAGRSAVLVGLRRRRQRQRRRRRRQRRRRGRRRAPNQKQPHQAVATVCHRSL